MSGGNLGRTLGDLWRARAESLALLHGDGDGLERITGGKLLRMVTCLGVGLQAQTLERETIDIAPLEPGTRVLIASQPRVEALALELVVWMLGGVTVHLDPRLSEAQFSEAVSRMKASVIFADTRRTLGGVELASDDAVTDASVILLDGAPSRPMPRMTSWQTLMDAGVKHRNVGFDRFAKAIFSVPGHARATIFYWPDEKGELTAAALSHEELLTAMEPPLPRSWVLAPGADVVFSTLDMGERENMLLTLRMLHHGLPLALPRNDKRLFAEVAAAAPTMLATSRDDLTALLNSLDRKDGDLSMRGVVKRGLGWLERQRDEEKTSVTRQITTNQLGSWAERGLANLVKEDLGGKLRIVRCRPEADVDDDTRALLKAAGITLVGSP